MSVTPDFIKGVIVLSITVSCTVIAYSILRQLKTSKTEEEVLVDSVEALESVDAVEAFNLVAYLSDLCYAIEVQAVGIGVVAGAVAFKTIAADSLFIVSITETVNKGLSALSDLFSAKAPEVSGSPDGSEFVSELSSGSSISELVLKDLKEAEVCRASQVLAGDPDYNLTGALEKAGKTTCENVDFLWEVSGKLGMPMDRISLSTPLEDRFFVVAGLEKKDLIAFAKAVKNNDLTVLVEDQNVSAAEYNVYLKRLLFMEGWWAAPPEQRAAFSASLILEARGVSVKHSPTLLQYLADSMLVEGEPTALREALKVEFGQVVKTVKASSSW